MKTWINSMLRKVGYEVRRWPPQAAPAESALGPEAGLPRVSLQRALEHIHSLRWQPASVVDVGAAVGQFTAVCRGVFPNARYLLVEPLVEYRPRLNALLAASPGASLAQVALGRVEGVSTLHVHRDWFGSSLYREAEGQHVDGVERSVSMRTLDALCAEYNLSAPYLVKVDVQGAELEVLAGGSQVLSQADYVILELSLFRSFVGGPQLHDVVAFMRELGFVAYDILELTYRLVDGALGQVDMAFVRDEGAFRTTHAYATREQRAAQDLAFQRALGAVVRD